MAEKNSTHQSSAGFVRIQDLENATKGQAFKHSLSGGRDWDDALNAIHILLLRKWYYVGLPCNTLKGGKIADKGLNFARKRANLPEDAQKLIRMTITNFNALRKKIRLKQVQGGQDRDVWHLTGSWKDFPEGAKLIEIKQSKLTDLLGIGEPRMAYIVLDGKAGAAEADNAMKLVHKVLVDKAYTAKVLAAAKQGGPEKPVTKALDLKGARKPGGLVMAMRDEPTVAATLTLAEVAILLDYFKKLKAVGDFNDEHARLLVLIENRHKQLKLKAQ